MGIDKQRYIKKDNPKVREEPFREGEVQNLIPFDDVIKIAFSPKEEEQNTDDKNRPYHIGKYPVSLKV